MVQTVLTQPGGGWDPFSLAYGQTPPVVTGDILITPATSSPGGYAVTPTADGIVSVAANGDRSRQVLASVDIFDTSLNALYGAADIAINDQAPLTPEPGTTFFFPLNVALTPVDLTGYTPDPELDPVVVTAVSSPPTGLAVVNSAWTGTPTVRGITLGVTLRSTDLYNNAVDWAVDIVVGPVSVPRLIASGALPALDEASAVAALAAAYLLADVAYIVSQGTPGIVLLQSLPAGTDVDPKTVIGLVISMAPPIVKPRNLTGQALNSSTVRLTWLPP